MKTRIGTKLAGVVALVVGVAFVVCAVLASRYFYSILKDQVVSDEMHKLNQTSRQLRYIQEEVDSLAKAIAVDKTIQDSITRDFGTDVFDALANKLEVSDALASHLSMKSYFYSAYIISSEGDVYSSNRTQGDFDFFAEIWYRDFKASGRKNGFSAAHSIYVTQRSSKREVISYILSFRDLYSGKQDIGDIVINVDFAQILKNATVDMSLLNGYTLFDRNGNVILQEGQISPEGLQQIEAGVETLPVRGNNILIIDRSMNDGWYFVSEVSGALLQEKLRFVWVFFIMMYAIVLAVLLLLLYRVILGITQPINELARIAAEVGKGNFDCRVTITTNDELSELGERFNSMVDDLKQYVERSIEYEKTTREMELNRLMLQINPHFIYNTLNSIVYMAQQHNNQDILNFAQSFVALLQDTLMVGKEDFFTNLEQEMRNIQNYLVLQSYRYPDRFEVNYNIDAETLPCQVPNVLIQPLVENAVFHGIASKPDKGRIDISARREENNLVITVEDDGVGMSAEKIQQLLSDDSQISGMMRTIGIANVKNRIEHLYGEEFGIEVFSEPGSGTRIKIVLPFCPAQ